MKLFSFRMRATSVFSFDTGMSTRRCFDPHALRIRVSISATGSVMLIDSSFSSRIRGGRGGTVVGLLAGRLPAGFANAGDHARERQVAEADAAHAELPQVCARTPAALAAVVD